MCSDLSCPRPLGVLSQAHASLFQPCTALSCAYELQKKPPKHIPHSPQKNPTNQTKSKTQPTHNKTKSPKLKNFRKYPHGEIAFEPFI